MSLSLRIPPRSSKHTAQAAFDVYLVLHVHGSLIHAHRQTAFTCKSCMDLRSAEESVHITNSACKKRKCALAHGHLLLGRALQGSMSEDIWNQIISDKLSPLHVQRQIGVYKSIINQAN